MAFLEIEIRDGVTKRLHALGATEFVGAALMAGAVAIKGKVAKYPPSRSTPGRYSTRTHRPMGYYKRGTGWFYPLLRGGKVRGYRNAKATSETLGRRWTVRARGSAEVVIGNNVSYGPWAQSRARVGNVGPQTRLLRAYNWQTIEDVAEQEGPRILARIESELQKKIQ